MGTEPALQRIQWRAGVSGLRTGGNTAVGAQGSKEHSLSFQVNSKARDEGGEPEPSEERSELKSLFDIPPGEAQRLL